MLTRRQASESEIPQVANRLASGRTPNAPTEFLEPRKNDCKNASERRFLIFDLYQYHIPCDTGLSKGRQMFKCVFVAIDI
ncbi:unnamed protein product [Callosobruchus maculatus]|uniref:Uncharacterized protein n=1 Tax=Callosobruchus maculatus TaxID=64391 RepID=A0A653D473_CALMS|nr:unnamed protein product [Callosobruchus maculatus]